MRLFDMRPGFAPYDVANGALAEQKPPGDGGSSLAIGMRGSNASDVVVSESRLTTFLATRITSCLRLEGLQPEMPPGSPVDDGVNIRCGDSNVFRDPQHRLTSCDPSVCFADPWLIQFRSVAFRSNKAAALGPHVMRVIKDCAHKKMLAVHTKRPIARVTDKHVSWRQLSGIKKYSEAMSANAAEFISAPKLAITVRVGTGKPDMALPKSAVVRMDRAILIDLGKETCQYFRIHELVPRGSGTGVSARGAVSYQRISRSQEAQVASLRKEFLS